MNPRLFRISIIFLTLAMITLACGLFGGEELPAVIPTDLTEAEPTDSLMVEEAIEAPEKDEPVAPTEMVEQPPDPEVQLDEEYRSIEGGFAFRPIPDYSLDEIFGFATMIAPDGSPDIGPAIVMIGEVLDQAATLDELYEAQIRELSTEDMVLSDPQDIVIGGAPGFSVDVKGTDDGVDVAGQFIILLANPNQQLTIIAASPTERWDNELAPLFEAVLGTITFFEPAVDLGDVPADTSEIQFGEEYRSEMGGYLFLEIPNFEFDETDGYVMMIAPGGDESNGPAIFMMGGTIPEEVTLDELYNEQIKNFSSDDVKFSSPREVTVGGNPGRSVSISGTDGDMKMAGQLTIILAGPKHMFFVGGLAPDDEWDEFSLVFDALLSTIAFFDPADSSANLLPKGDEIRQWAMNAFASSSYGNPDWHATQSTGEPDVPPNECVDSPQAWASEGSDSVEWLELTYETPVIPTQINIIQTHSPDQVVKVELVDLTGAYREIYTGVPKNLWDKCPYTLSIPVDVDFGVVGLKITIDQSVIPTTWNEIDAVELVGFEFDEGTATPPKNMEPPATTSEELSVQEPPVPSKEAGQVNDRLFELGYEICYPTDFFNSQTEIAVKAFQESNNLAVDGIVGQETWETLFSDDVVLAVRPTAELTFSEPLEGVHGDKITSSGSHLWVLARHYNYLEAYDTETGEFAGIFHVSSLTGEDNYTVQALVYDGNRLWIASQGDNDAIVQAYDLEVDPVEGVLTPLLPESIHLDDVIFIRGINYDGMRLWVTYESSAYPSGLAEINPVLGQVSQVIKFGFDEYASVPAFDGEQLWVAFEGGIGGYAVRPVEPLSGTIGEPIGICGYQVVYDEAGLWIVKDQEVWVVDPNSGEVHGIAQFDSMIKDITFSGARVYILLWDDSVLFYQVY